MVKAIVTKGSHPMILANSHVIRHLIQQVGTVEDIPVAECESYIVGLCHIMISQKLYAVSVGSGEHPKRKDQHRKAE